MNTTTRKSSQTDIRKQKQWKRTSEGPHRTSDIIETRNSKQGNQEAKPQEIKQRIGHNRKLNLKKGSNENRTSEIAHCTRSVVFAKAWRSSENWPWWRPLPGAKRTNFPRSLTGKMHPPSKNHRRLSFPKYSPLAAVSNHSSASTTISRSWASIQCIRTSWPLFALTAAKKKREPPRRAGAILQGAVPDSSKQVAQAHAYPDSSEGKKQSVQWNYFLDWSMVSSGNTSLY